MSSESNSNDVNLPALTPRALQQTVSSDLKNILSLVEKGEVGKISISAEEGRRRIIFDSSDGKQRTILEQRILPGMTENKHTQSTRLPKAERLESIKHLTMEGKTQQEIATLLVVSQKTVSNDQKALREQGEL